MERARWLQLDGEVAVKYVHDLPDASIRRYGRSDVFGVGPVNGVACAGPIKQCSNEGYVTPMAWGYRLRATVALRNVEGLALFPSIAFAHDVKGFSYDDMLSEKRMVASLSLRAAYGKRLFGELAWTSISGGAYNTAKDRDVVTATAGVSF